MFSLFKTEHGSILGYITNKHVVAGWDYCSFRLATRASDGTPDTNNLIDVRIDDLQTKIVSHPTVDLVFIPVVPTINALTASGKNPFFVTLDEILIPTNVELKALLPVEQILTVGFPGLLWDTAHNLPVFHRGYTTTAYIGFQGRKEFLIDIATWPGSSGSPVLLFNEGNWVTRNGGTVIGGLRVKLLGIVYGVGVQDVSGNVAIQNGPTQMLAQGAMAVPTNLGACLSSSLIFDFESVIMGFSGFTPPPGYAPRTR